MRMQRHSPGRWSIPIAASLVLFVLVSAGAAPPPLRTGILPFDVVSVSGASADTGASLAKLVRIQMIEGHKLAPVLLTLPADAQAPVTPEAAAAIGKAASVDAVIVGTVIDASTSESSHSANTGGLLSGIGVGGSINRTSATVSIHVDLVDPSNAAIADSFDVDGKASATGVGMDFSTALGGLDSGSGWQDTPMGKALMQAAKKINDETAKRASKFGR